MDGWNAPQWADFDASVMSDIDEYFNIHQEDLEAQESDDLQYESCPDTPNSKRGIAGTPYRTPKSGTSDGHQEVTNYMKHLQINAEKKLIKTRLSMTPRAFALRKSCLRSTRSSTPKVIKQNSERTAEDAKTQDEEPFNIDIKIAENSEGVAAEAVVANSEFVDNGEDENAEQNCTLVADAESSQISSNHANLIVPSEVNEQPRIESSNKTEKPVTEEIIDRHTEDPMKPEIIFGKTENPTKSEIIVEKTENPTKSEIIDEKTEILDIVDKEEISIVPTHTDNSAGTSLSSIDIKKDENLDEAKTKLSKLQNRLDPSRRMITDKRKNLRGKPTVLTSHARRQSTSKYRRASNKYVSLAEAVSKFQNGTPERFRSSNHKDAKAAIAGPLQKVRQTLKVTSATSPLLRCKYRARAVSVPNQEEREILEIQEIRKNLIKPNPIRQSVMNPPKKLTKTTPLPQVPSNMQKTTKNVPLEKINKNPTRISKGLPSTHKTAMDPPKMLKKIDRPKTTDDTSSTRRKTMMNPPKPLEKIKKSTTMPDARRTMMNPPKAMEKNKKPANISGTSSSTRTTMMNPPKPLTKIDDKATKISEPFSLTHETLMNPPETMGKNVSKSKSLTESFALFDKNRDTLMLSTSTLSESMRKHTPCKKTVRAVVSTDQGASIKDVEILHFGIPVGNDYKKITKTVPFSFDIRNKELQNKKDKLKNRQIEEEKKTKTFHARPVPAFVTKPPSTTAKTPSKALVSHCPFSFQHRNELILKKKKEMFDQIVEREKQARIFHAKPAPNFKPVFVRGASAENLRANNSSDNGTKITVATRQKGLSQSSISDNRENTAPNVVQPSQQIPKLKNPLTTHNFKIKKTAM